MANKTEQQKHAELMEMKTNKAAKQLVKVITSSDLQPLASIVSIVKATAIILESYKAVGEDADYLEMILKSTIGPARQEVRESAADELARLRAENKRLSEALKMAEWMNHAKDVMIDEAEKTFNIPINAIGTGE